MQFRNEFAFLSNFYTCPVTMPDGFTYPCGESAFQAQKSDDPDVKRLFVNAKGPEAKRLGRHVKLRYDWNSYRLTAMQQVIDAKFADPALAQRLMEIRDEIVEDNTWGDKYWGRCNGIGENHLGIILMRKRDTLLGGAHERRI